MTVRNHGSLPPGVGASPLQADSWPHAGARHPGRLSLGTRMVTSIPALAISIPATRPANSGSSPTSCIRQASETKKAVTWRHLGCISSLTATDTRMVHQ
jgi:hypothetical protein